MLARWRQSAKCSAIAYSLPAAACCACFAAELTYIKVLHDLELYLEFDPNPTHHPPASHPTFVKPTHNWNFSIFFLVFFFCCVRASLYTTVYVVAPKISIQPRVAAFQCAPKAPTTPELAAFPNSKQRRSQGMGSTG